MGLTRIASWTVWALPLLGIAMAVANWVARPDRAWPWVAAIAVFVVMLGVRHLAQVAIRRSAGDPMAVKSLASVPAAVAWGAAIMVAALAVNLAQASGVLTDAEIGARLTMAIIGASLAASGNALPRMLPPVSAMGDQATRVQAFQRLAGRIWVAAGLGFAAAWLVLPIDLATPASVAVVACAMAVTVAQLLPLRKASGETPQRLG